MLNYCSVFHFYAAAQKTENCEDQKKTKQKTKQKIKMHFWGVCVGKLIIS